MSSIDNRIVYMQFNNKEFEKNAKQSIDTLDKLKMALNFKGLKNGFDQLEGVSLAAFRTTVDTGERAFSNLEQVATGALRHIGEQITNTGEQFIKSLSVDQISSGFQKYETEVGSVQTIMNATGKSIEEVQKHLDKLMWFTDETSYSFSDMTSNIGKFTSAGVELGDATEAMMGISNWAALAGQGVNEASRAMYNLSQAMSLGEVRLMDWHSIENANMATTEFKQSVIDSAVALGTLKRAGNGLYTTMDDNEVSVTNFNEALSDGWFTADVLLKTLRQYNEYTEEVYRVAQTEGISASEAMELIGDSFQGSGEKAFKAAQEAKTFTDAINSIKDAISTGWLKSFDLIFGNYVEAKNLWTELANLLWDTFASGGEERNEQLKVWREDFDGRTKLVNAFLRLVESLNFRLDVIKGTLTDVFGSVWDAENLNNATDIFSGFVDRFVNSQHILMRFMDDIKPFLIGVRGVVVAIGRIFGVAAEQGKAFVQGVGSNSFFDPKNTAAFNSIAQSLLNFANRLSQSGDSLSKFYVLGSNVGTILAYLATSIKDIFGAAKTSISEVFGPIDIYKILNSVLTWIADRLLAIKSAFSGMNRGQRIFKGVLSVAGILAKVLVNLVSAIEPHLSALVDFLAPRILEVFAKLGDLIANLNEGNVSNLGGAFKILSGILGGIGKVAYTVYTWFEKIKNTFSKLSDKLAEAKGVKRLKDDFDLLGDSIKGLFKTKGGEDVTRTITEGNKSIEDSFEFVDLLVPVIDAVADAIANLIEAVPAAVETISGFFSAFQNGSENAEENTSFFDTLKDKIANLFTGFDEQTLLEGAANWAGTVITGFAQGLSQIDFEKIKGLSLFIGLIVALVQLNKILATGSQFMDNLKKIPLGIGDFVNNINGVIKSVKGVADQIKKSIADLTRVQQLTAFTWALVALVGAVIALSMLPRDDVARGLVVLGIIAVIIKALTKEGTLIYQNTQKSTKTFGNLNINVLNSKQFGIGVMIAAIAGLILSVVAAIKMLSGINPTDLSRGLTVVLLSMIALFAFLGSMAMVQKRYGVEQLTELKLFGNSGKDAITTSIIPKGIVPFLIAMAIAIKMIAGVVKTLGQMNITDLETGMFGVFAIMGLLGLFTAGIMGLSAYLGKQDPAFFKDIGKTMILLGASMVIMSFAIDLMLPAIAAFALIGRFGDLSAALLGVSAITGLFAVFAGLSYLTRNVKGSNMILLASSFAIMAAAVDIIVPAIAILAMLPDDAHIWKAVGALSAVMLALGVAMTLGGVTNRSSGDSNGVLKTASAFLILSIAIGVIAAVLDKLSTGNYDQGFQNFAVAVALLVGSLLLLTGITYLLSKIPGAFPILESLAMVLGSTALVFAAFGAGLWLVGEALPPIAEYLPLVGIALAEFLAYLDGHWTDILFIVGGITVIAVVIGVVLSKLFGTVTAFFRAIGGVLDNAGKKFGDLPDKTKILIASLVISAIAGLAAATPEMVKSIGATIVKILGYLGELAPSIIDGLFVLLVNIIHGLADAIRNNAGALLVALEDVAESVLEVIVRAVGMVLNNLSDASRAISKTLVESDNPVLKVLGTLFAFDQSRANTFVDDWNAGVDDMFSAMRNHIDEDRKKFARDTEDGVDDTGDTLTKSVADKISETVRNINATDTAGNKLDIAGMILGDGGAVDMSKFNSILEQVQNGSILMDESSVQSFMNIDTNFEGMTNGMLENGDLLNTGMEDIWGQYAQTAETGADDAKQAVEDNTDATLNYLTDKRVSFYQAGVNLMNGLKEGIQYGYQFVKASIVSNANDMNNSFTAFQRIESPSRVWAGFGSYMMEGLANGINDSADNAVNAVTTIANIVNDAFADDSEYVPTIRPVVDMSRVSASAGSVNGFFANQSMTLAGINGTLEAQGISLREQMNQNRIYNDSNVLASMQGLRNDVNTLADSMAQMQIVMDTGATVGALAPGIDKAIGVRRTLKGRGV